MRSRTELVHKRQKWRSPSSASEGSLPNPKTQMKRFGEAALETENNFLERELERLKQLALQRKAAKESCTSSQEQAKGLSDFDEKTGGRSRNVSFSTGTSVTEVATQSPAKAETLKKRSSSVSSLEAARFHSSVGSSNNSDDLSASESESQLVCQASVSQAKCVHQAHAAYSNNTREASPLQQDQANQDEDGSNNDHQIRAKVRHVLERG